MIDTDFLRLLDRFDLIIRKKVTSNFQGSRESPSYGSGLSFKDYKDYVRGDDFRKIDWKVYARTEKFYIKRFEEERNLTVHIVMDRSASMNFGTKVKKYEYAAQIGLGFAYMAAKNNEKFEYSTFSDKLYPLRARKGKNQLVSILDYLNTIDVKGTSKFYECMAQYKKLITSRSLIVMISDFLFEPEQLKRVLGMFRRHEVIVVQVLDIMEKHLLVDGDVILDDSETKQKLKTYISKRLKQNYFEKLNVHINELKDLCDLAGAKFHCVSTEDPIFETFTKILR